MNWLKKVVDDRGIDLDELAEVVDLAPRTVREYYAGTRKIGWKAKMNLMKILDLTEEDIDETERELLLLELQILQGHLR